ncbi:MAG: hypothetical protein H6738_02740 [Alphaproteobacteria bacterium]|nr:hypothetical protein [Alphaproteobacteria bacterium]MCB9695687.1 hypothetical protein [Alphaproteobacteria bacterium]
MDLALPNLHPALVHFPVVLVPMALLVEALSALSPEAAVRRAAAGTWALAALSAVATYLAGRAAADGLTDVPAQVQPHIGAHSDWATATLVLIIGAAALRAVAELRTESAPMRLVRAAGVCVGLAAGAVLFVTADKGGALVYRHAVAVTVPECPACEAPAPRGEPAPAADGGELLSEEGGLFAWAPRSADLEGLAAREWPERGVALIVDGSQEVLFDRVFGDVQVNAWLDLTAFDGEVELLHHQSNGTGGAFVLATTGEARLVDRTPELSVLDSAAVELTGRHALAVNAAGYHLKGLVDGRTVVHGHAAAHPEGRISLRFEGTGVIGIERVEIVPLEEP